MLKRIGLRVNTVKDEDYSVTESLVRELKEFGFEPVMSGTVAEHFGQSAISEQEWLRRCDAVFVLGGDGTLLDIISKAARCGIPVMGINMGRIGFLTEVETHELREVLARLQSGDYTLEERMMLQCEYDGQTIYALNEFGIHRAMHESIIHLAVYADDQLVDGFFADGVIVASPTGSTGYSLSAGGPILAPTVRALLLTPICAHTLRSRPMVLDDREIITIRSVGQEDASLLYDGKEIAIRGENFAVKIRRAPFSARFLRVKNGNFYKLLEKKLNEWSVPKN